MKLDSIKADDPYATVVYNNYDAQGRPTSMTVGGHTFDYDYSSSGYTLTDSADTQKLFSATFSYDEALLPPSIPTEELETVNGDYAISRTFDASGRPGTVEIKRPGTTDTLLKITYTYDPQTHLLTHELREFSNQSKWDIAYNYLPYVTGNTAEIMPFVPLESVTITRTPPAGEAVPTPLKDRDNKDIDPNIHKFLYVYDAAGNLKSILYAGPYSATPIDSTNKKYNVDAIACIEYGYDGANRLISVHNADQNLDLGAYSYDVFNRLVSTNDQHFVYVDRQATPSFVYDAHDKPVPLNVIQSNGQSGWILDGLGRALSLSDDMSLSNDKDNRCQTGSFVGHGDPPSGTLFKGMVVDPNTGLAFINGRAYQPEIGRFLQRASVGINFDGNVYGLPTSNVPAPVVRQPQKIGAGLQMLNFATSLNVFDHPETADSIATTYLPAMQPMQGDFLGLVDSRSRFVSSSLQKMWNLPSWLQQDYNQPGPQINAVSGMISWDTSLQNGQHGSSWKPSSDFSAPFWQGTLPSATPATTPAFTLSHLMAIGQIQVIVPVTNRPYGSQLSGGLFYDLQNTPAVTLDDNHTPASVLGWLLPTWLHVEQNTSLLDLTDQIVAQPSQGGTAWLENSLGIGLPTLPPSPYRDFRDWYGQRFIPLNNLAHSVNRSVTEAK